MAKKRLATCSNFVLADRLDILLHTVRCIAQHEDALCTLLHEVRSTGTLSAECADDLRKLLAEMPAEEYAWQLHSVELSVEAKRPMGAAA